jgi:hypothetical protein
MRWTTPDLPSDQLMFEAIELREYYLCQIFVWKDHRWLHILGMQQFSVRH